MKMQKKLIPKKVKEENLCISVEGKKTVSNEDKKEFKKNEAKEKVKKRKKSKKNLEDEEVQFI